MVRLRKAQSRALLLDGTVKSPYITYSSRPFHWQYISELQMPYLENDSSEVKKNFSSKMKWKWNEWVKRTSWGLWDELDDVHCPPDTGFRIRSLVVWGRARYLSVMESPHNIEFLQVSAGKTFFWNVNAREGLELAISDYSGRQL